MSIVTEICGRSSKGIVFCLYDFVKVTGTDPNHEDDEERKFCWKGSYGQVMGKFSKKERFVLVQFTVIKKDGVETKNVGLLCDNLKIIND